MPNPNEEKFKEEVQNFIANNPGSTIEDFNRRETEGLGPDVPENIHHRSGPLPYQIPAVRDAMVKNDRGTLEHTEESQKLFQEHYQKMKYPGDYVAEGLSPNEANIESMKNLDYHYSVQDSIQNQQGRYQDQNFIETMKNVTGGNYTTGNIPAENQADYLQLTSSIQEKNVSPYGVMDPTELAKGLMTIDPNDPFQKAQTNFWSKEIDAQQGGYTGHKMDEMEKMMLEMGNMRDPRGNSGETPREKLNRLKNNRNFMNNPPPTP